MPFSSSSVAKQTLRKRKENERFRIHPSVLTRALSWSFWLIESSLLDSEPRRLDPLYLVHRYTETYTHLPKSWTSQIALKISIKKRPATKNYSQNFNLTNLHLSILAILWCKIFHIPSFILQEYKKKMTSCRFNYKARGTRWMQYIAIRSSISLNLKSRNKKDAIPCGIPCTLEMPEKRYIHNIYTYIMSIYIYIYLGCWESGIHSEIANHPLRHFSPWLSRQCRLFAICYSRTLLAFPQEKWAPFSPLPFPLLSPDSGMLGSRLEYWYRDEAMRKADSYVFSLPLSLSPLFLFSLLHSNRQRHCTNNALFPFPASQIFIFPFFFSLPSSHFCTRTHFSPLLPFFSPFDVFFLSWSVRILAFRKSRFPHSLSRSPSTCPLGILRGIILRLLLRDTKWFIHRSRDIYAERFESSARYLFAFFILFPSSKYHFSCFFYSSFLWLLWSTGLQRIHHPCHEPPEGTESHEAHHAQGNRKDGTDHSQKVLQHPNAAETIHLWSCHDPQKSIPRCKVRETISILPFSCRYKTISFRTLR